MSSDNNLRKDIEEIRNALKGATERLRALEDKVDQATDRMIYIGACEQKLRDIRNDLDTVLAKLSVPPNINADGRRLLLRSLQQELDRPRLPEIEVRYLGSYFECLRRISTTIREDMLNSRDISEPSLRYALKEFYEVWRRAEEQETAEGPT
jgi:hypothetical protein